MEVIQTGKAPELSVFNYEIIVENQNLWTSNELQLFVC
jgi:hypothetical protein